MVQHVYVVVVLVVIVAILCILTLSRITFSHSHYIYAIVMMDLLRERAADLYRTKGVLSFHGQGDTKFVFQGVHEQINFGPSQHPWGKDEERTNKFVFIGKGLDRAELTKSLMECLYKNDDETK